MRAMVTETRPSKGRKSMMMAVALLTPPTLEVEELPAARALPPNVPVVPGPGMVDVVTGITVVLTVIAALIVETALQLLLAGAGEAEGVTASP